MSKPHDRTDPASVLARTLGPDAPELSCEECFAQIDRYVDLELAGADAEGSIPGMRAHLAGCPACDEDHDSLLSLLSTE